MWNEKPRIGLVVSYAPLEAGWEEAPGLIEKALAALGGLEVSVEAFEKPVFDIETALAAGRKLIHARVDAVVWLAATWSFDNWALEFLRICPVPLIAWGVPGMETGSVCGSQQLNAVLAEVDLPHGFVHGNVDDPKAHKTICSFAQGAAAAQRLSEARFGMLGHRTLGMTEVTFHEYDLFEQFGSLVYYQGIDRFLTALNQTDEIRATSLWKEFQSRCGTCHVDDDCGVEAMRGYLALRDWIDRDLLMGVAVGCYPDLMGIVCLGCGLLAEEGVVTSCEGDMNSLVLSAAMQLMSGGPVHNTDFLFADETDNTCTMSHCGNSAIALAADQEHIALEHVRLMDRGVVTLYPGAPGRVTIANLCGRQGSYRLTCYTGQAVPTEKTFPGIPVKVKLDIPVRDFLEETAELGTGHHWIVAYGDIIDALDVFSSLRAVSRNVQCGKRGLEA